MLQIFDNNEDNLKEEELNIGTSNRIKNSTRIDRTKNSSKIYI